MTPCLVIPRGRLRRVVAAGLVLTAGVLLAACGTDTASTGTKQAAEQAAGNPATVTTIAGNTVRVPGSKTAALFFFSAGCGECAGGAKSLAKAADTVGAKADFLAVDMDPSESKQTITQFLGAIGSPTLPAAVDRNAALSQRFQVSALSTLIVVDMAGKVTYRATDPAPDQIQAALTKAGAR